MKEKTLIFWMGGRLSIKLWRTNIAREGQRLAAVRDWELAILSDGGKLGPIVWMRNWRRG